MDPMGYENTSIRWIPFVPQGWNDGLAVATNLW
jgi:hypothetical protein